MANFLGELLIQMLANAFRSFLEREILVKFGTWLDTKIQKRTLKIVLGLLLGVAAYFLIPITLGLLSL